MTFPHFTAEQSLYCSGRHYRASALASTAGGVRPSDYQPNGSYLQSCYNCTYYLGFLSCSCYDGSGNVQQTYLPYTNYCAGDIYNSNGVLGCHYR